MGAKACWDTTNKHDKDKTQGIARRYRGRAVIVSAASTRSQKNLPLRVLKAWEPPTTIFWGFYRDQGIPFECLRALRNITSQAFWFITAHLLLGRWTMLQRSSKPLPIRSSQF